MTEPSSTPERHDPTQHPSQPPAAPSDAEPSGPADGAAPGAVDDASEDAPAAADDRDPASAASAPRRRWWRRLARSARFWSVTSTVVIAVLGGIVGVLLAPASSVQVGPLSASVHLRPALTSDTVILLPPVGEVHFDTHTAPVRIEARIKGVDIAAAEDLLYSDQALAELEQSAPEALTAAAARNAAITAVFGAAGAALAVALTYRRLRRTLIAAGGAAAVVVASTAAMAVTFRPQALYQPSFDGLLSQASSLVGLGQGTAVDYSSYRSLLGEFVGQVSALYIAADSVPTGLGQGDVITVLHVSDIHDNPQAYDVISQLEDQFPIDLVIDTGDIVSWGTGYEHDQLSRISDISSPYVFIGGNHDGAATSAAVAANANATVLENEVVDIEGLLIAGIGDPRFAADDDSTGSGWQAGKEAVSQSGYQLGDTITQWDEEHPDEPVDLALIHDPTQPEGLEGRVPLVLSGHMHTPDVELDRDGTGTDWFTAGSTGGALASGGVYPVLEGDDPLDLSARLMYFDADSKELLAYDDITMGGLGLVSVSIERTQMPEEQTGLEVPEDQLTPDSPVPTELEVEPGQGVPDEDRVTPTDPASPLPDVSDGGGG